MIKKGFTYLEVMIAISIFAILFLTIIKLNALSENNLNAQLNSQKMMFVAQKRLEEYKTTQVADPNFALLDGYYVQLISDNTPGGALCRVTITVRRDSSSTNGEIALQSHVLKN